MAKDFIKTWDGRRLEDWGSTVSKEYKSFQRAMKSEVERIAREEGAMLVSYNSGHYYQSGFLERDGLYVYFCYEALDRCKVQLASNGPFYMRTAEGPKDFHGGSNNNVPFENFRETMRRLFSWQARGRHADTGFYAVEHTSSQGYRFTLTLFDFGVHVQVLSADGALIYHKEIWPGVWDKAYDIYEQARRSIFDEGSDIYPMLNSKAQAPALAA